jgi:hypothetical protein
MQIMKNAVQPTEHQIQSVILEYLRCNDVWAYRVNSGQYALHMQNKFGRTRSYWVMGAPAGTPDIIGVLGKKYKQHFGRMIAVEVKKPGGKTTDTQDRIINELLDHGAYAFVAYSCDDVEEQLERLKK